MPLNYWACFLLDKANQGSYVVVSVGTINKRYYLRPAFNLP